MKYNFYGILSYNDYGDFVLIDETDKFNFTLALDKIYAENEINTRLIIKTNRLICDCEEMLYIKKDEQELFAYHIEDFNIDKTLFAKVNEFIEITLYTKINLQGCFTTQDTYAKDKENVS